MIGTGKQPTKETEKYNVQTPVTSPSPRGKGGRHFLEPRLDGGGWSTHRSGPTDPLASDAAQCAAMYASRGTQSHLHSSKPVASFRMRTSIGFSALAREIPWRRADASTSAADPQVALVANPLIHIPVESLTTTPSPAIEGGLQAISQFILTTSRGGVTQCVWVRTSRLGAANKIGTPSLDWVSSLLHGNPKPGIPQRRWSSVVIRA